MKKMFAISLFFLFFSMWSSVTLSYAISLALWVKGNKIVGTIGDYHKEGKKDICHKNLFSPFLEQLAKSDQESEIVLEHIFEEDLEPTSEKDICLDLFSRYAYQHGLKHGNLSFILSNFQVKLPALRKFLKYVFNFVLSFLINKYTDEDFKSVVRENVSTKELLDTIKVVLDLVKELKQTITNPGGKALLAQLEGSIKIYDARLKLLFLKHTHEVTLKAPSGFEITLKPGSVAAAFIEALQKGDLKDADISYVFKTYIDPALNLTEIGLIRDIIESQKRVNKTLVYAGAEHIKVVNKMLLELGYTPIAQPPLGFFLRGSFFEGFEKQPIPSKELEDFFKLFLTR